MSLVDSFNKFRSERIRELRDRYTIVTNEKVTLKEMAKAYNRWAVVTPGSKKMHIKDLETLCETSFGDSRGKQVYSHIRVFLDEEDVEEFEEEHTQYERELEKRSEEWNFKNKVVDELQLRFQQKEEEIGKLQCTIASMKLQNERDTSDIRSHERALGIFSDTLYQIIKENKKRDEQLIKMIDSLKTLNTPE